MSAPAGKKLAPAPPKYSPENENQTRQKIEAELNRAVKRDEEYQPVRLVIVDPATGFRYLLTASGTTPTLTLIT